MVQHQAKAMHSSQPQQFLKGFELPEVGWHLDSTEAKKSVLNYLNLVTIWIGNECDDGISTHYWTSFASHITA